MQQIYSECIALVYNILVILLRLLKQWFLSKSIFFLTLFRLITWINLPSFIYISNRFSRLIHQLYWIIIAKIKVIIDFRVRFYFYNLCFSFFTSLFTFDKWTNSWWGSLFHTLSSFIKYCLLWVKILFKIFNFFPIYLNCFLFLVLLFLVHFLVVFLYIKCF